MEKISGFFQTCGKILVDDAGKYRVTANDYKNPLTLAMQNLDNEDNQATKTADGWKISKDDLTIQPSCYPIIKGTLIGFPDD